MDRRSRECRMKGNKSRYGPLSTSSGELFRTVNNDMSSGTTSFSDPNARQVKCTRKCIYMNVRSPNYRRLNYRSNLKFLLSIFMFASTPSHPPLPQKALEASSIRGIRPNLCFQESTPQPQLSLSMKRTTQSPWKVSQNTPSAWSAHTSPAQPCRAPTGMPYTLTTIGTTLRRPLMSLSTKLAHVRSFRRRSSHRRSSHSCDGTAC